MFVLLFKYFDLTKYHHIAVQGAKYRIFYVTKHISTCYHLLAGELLKRYQEKEESLPQKSRTAWLNKELKIGVAYLIF